ncbi:MAG TPA: E3 binding domain-containing protein, partial [Nitrospira sp.]|nr:E3 binding domain-containing protein [Nitrospira sp.]
MATDIVMPQLGESIAEGTVIKWLIPPGGMVEKDQPLLEVETEKVALDIPAPATGVLREVLVQEGATVPVGTVLARLEHEPVETVMSRVGGVGVRARNSAAEGAPHYSPAVKQVAREHDIQLSEVTGSGEGGRITKKDVLDAAAKRGTSTPTPSAAPTLPNAEEELVPFTHMRKTIAERMVSSRRTSAHVTTFFEADCSGI